MSDAAGGFFPDPEAAPKIAQMPGVETRIITGLAGEKMMMVLTTILPGCAVPTHAHSHEQIGVVYSGQALMRVGDEEKAVRQGDFARFPSDVPHSAACLGDEPFIMVDIFCPGREDFLAKLAGNRPGGART